jgi:integrase
MNRLTDIEIKNWVKDGHPIAGKSDGGGLTFTLSKAGRASWVLRYRYGGKGREITIGNYPDISLKDARVEATKLRAKVDMGANVAADKRKTKLAASTARSFKELSALYLEKSGAKVKESTRKETGRYLTKDINPRIGSLAANEITVAEIINIVEQIAKRSQSVARRAFEILSVIFSFGMSRQIVPKNVCAGLKVSDILGEIKPRRQRIYLSEDELRVMLPTLHSLGIENALMVKILLATCTRKSELLKARWDEVDLVTGIWTIPANNIKRRKSAKPAEAFRIPLPPTVIDWFQQLKALAVDSPYVLPARKRGYGKKSDTISKSTLNAALDRVKLGVTDFTPHDLRSTARSHLGAMGVDIITAERCLNHELGGLVPIYDKNDYLDNRRGALELWARFLNECEMGIKRDLTNVIPLHA